jgi:hypothetical protein
MELIGYLASLIIVISMTMTSVIKLRIFNGIGALLFSFYGFMIEAYPVGILNGLIAIINIYHLKKMFAQKETFEFLPINYNNPYIHRFVEFYYDDIKKFFPSFELNKNNYDVCLLMLRNMSVAGLFMASKSNDNSLWIELDYVIEKYRDLKNGHHLYKYLEEFLKPEYIKVFRSNAHSDAFKKYLTDIGFKLSDNILEKYLF